MSAQYPTLIHERVAMAERGENPWAIGRLEGGWVVAADTQPLEGYCLLLSNPVAASLNELPEERRLIYLRDTVRVGDAILKVTGCARINYETWCNLDPALHTHIVPRYKDEPDGKLTKPACTVYDFQAARRFDRERDSSFVQKMRAALAPFLLDR